MGGPEKAWKAVGKFRRDGKAWEVTVRYTMTSRYNKDKENKGGQREQ